MWRMSTAWEGRRGGRERKGGKGAIDINTTAISGWWRGTHTSILGSMKFVVGPMFTNSCFCSYKMMSWKVKGHTIISLTSNRCGTQLAYTISFWLGLVHKRQKFHHLQGLHHSHMMSCDKKWDNDSVNLTVMWCHVMSCDSMWLRWVQYHCMESKLL